jgi:CRP-like cAMP-binding protein
MVGLALLIDDRASVYRVLQEVEGESLRVPAGHFKATLDGSGPLRRLLERYSMTVTHQSGRNAACNLRHNIGQRLCRWLLMSHDRVPGDEFFLTQEDLANMLGVRRQSVTDVAKPLQEAGLIAYSRGNIRIVDRAGLEAAACECYAALKEMYERVMGGS